MSGGLAPSKSTVYVGNLPFSLTNNDIHKILEKHGKVVKVTIVKDKVTKRSKGVAFVLYLERDSAHKCVHALNNTQMFGRTIKCSIANDNGRAAEFIRRKEYKDKSYCYECGEDGHLSYQCPKNLLGEREPPPKKPRKRKSEYGDPLSDEEEEEEEEERKPKKKKTLEQEEEQEEEEESEEGEDPRLETLAAAVQEEQEKLEVEEYRYRVATGQYDLPGESSEMKKKKYKKDAYFSDEEDLDDD